VLPHFKNVWDEDGWENHWWPQALKPNGKLAGRHANGGGAQAAK